MHPPRTRQSFGMIEPPRRGPWKVALDLYRAGGSFRGFAEFAVIGAIVLAFLNGIHLANPFASHTEGRGFNPRNGIATLPAESGPKGVPNRTSLSERSVLRPPVPGDLEPTPAYFERAEEPLRGRLITALSARTNGDTATFNAALAAADADHPLVLLLKSINALAAPAPVSRTAGMQMLARAIEAGEPRAMTYLGVLKMIGLPGIPRDLEGGRALLERAAAAGDGPGARVLGETYLSAWGGALDPARGEQYLRLAVSKGDAKAAFELGELLYAGQGLPKNEKEAVALITQAAEAGYDVAQTMLGVLRLTAYSSGLTNSPEEALHWLERAAAQGEQQGMYYLGLFYAEMGERAGLRDVPKGIDLFRRCAEQTLYLQCVFAYGIALDLGVGATHDPVKAYAMYNLAAAMEPFPKASYKRDALGKKLSAEEIARANVIATEMLEIRSRAKAAKRGTPVPN